MCVDPKLTRRKVLWPNYALTLGCVLFAPPISASPVYELPEGCGSGSDFETAIRERLGNVADAVLAATSLRIRKDADEYTLDVQVGSRTRRLRDHSCTDLFYASVVVTVTLWESPTASNDAPSVEPHTERQTEASPPVRPSAVSVTRSAPPIRAVIAPPQPKQNHSAITLTVQGRLGLTEGILPRTSPWLGLRGAFEYDNFGFALSARALYPNSTHDSRGYGVKAWAMGGTAGAYYLPHNRIGAEAGVAGHRISGRGLGAAHNQQATVWALGPYLGLFALPYKEDGLDVVLGAEAQFPLLRPRFEILSYDEVFRVSPASFTAYCAFGYSFR